MANAPPNSPLSFSNSSPPATFSTLSSLCFFSPFRTISAPPLGQILTHNDLVFIRTIEIFESPLPTKTVICVERNRAAVNGVARSREEKLTGIASLEAPFDKFQKLATNPITLILGMNVSVTKPVNALRFAVVIKIA